MWRSLTWSPLIVGQVGLVHCLVFVSLEQLSLVGKAQIPEEPIQMKRFHAAAQVERICSFERFDAFEAIGFPMREGIRSRRMT
jgi:hypothetical protein